MAAIFDVDAVVRKSGHGASMLAGPAGDSNPLVQFDKGSNRFLASGLEWSEVFGECKHTFCFSGGEVCP